DGIRYFHVTGVQTCALPIFESYSSSQTSPSQPGYDQVETPKRNCAGSCRASALHSCAAGAGSTLAMSRRVETSGFAREAAEFEELLEGWRSASPKKSSCILVTGTEVG